jgi:hypothetical protein
VQGRERRVDVEVLGQVHRWEGAPRIPGGLGAVRVDYRLGEACCTRGVEDGYGIVFGELPVFGAGVGFTV